MIAETLPVYVNKYGTEYLDVVHDDYGDVFTPDYEQTLKYSHDRDAQWWCVALYNTYQVYGGPEEGGWWYQAGYLVEHHKIRFFTDYKSAREYLDDMWAYANGQNVGYSDERMIARGFTEEMPQLHFPSRRPHYC